MQKIKKKIILEYVTGMLLKLEDNIEMYAGYGNMPGSKETWRSLIHETSFCGLGVVRY
jgi:hypothetical protein